MIEGLVALLRSCNCLLVYLDVLSIIPLAHTGHLAYNRCSLQLTQFQKQFQFSQCIPNHDSVGPCLHHVLQHPFLCLRIPAPQDRFMRKARLWLGHQHQDVVAEVECSELVAAAL